MTAPLRLDQGTLTIKQVPRALEHFFTWDARSQNYRAPGRAYRDIVLTAKAAGLPLKDEAASFTPLTLALGKQQAPYPHQTQALAAWKAAGRRGVVVLPTGAGKTFVAQLALRDTPRTALICVPTIDLLQQWYSGLVAAFPDASVGMLGGGSKDRTPVLVSTYDSAAIHAADLAGEYALLICDEVHHLPSAFTRVIAELSLAPYRLGLSATPSRGDGRERDLDELIGPVVYTARPADLTKTILAPYREVLITVRMNAQEQAQYDACERVLHTYLRRHGLEHDRDWYVKLLRACGTPAGQEAMRAHREGSRIAFGTEAKLRVLEELLAEHRGERTIIFTNDNESVYRISREFLIPAVTHQTPAKERHETLERFRGGAYRAVVTSRVLNEGVDVPEASVGVVLSGTSREREHVQRLGRILRPFPGKNAVQYEVVTLGTREEKTSARRKGQGGARTYPSGAQQEPFWEDLNAPD